MVHACAPLLRSVGPPTEYDRIYEEMMGPSRAAGEDSELVVQQRDSKYCGRGSRDGKVRNVQDDVRGRGSCRHWIARPSWRASAQAAFRYGLSPTD